MVFQQQILHVRKAASPPVDDAILAAEASPPCASVETDAGLNKALEVTTTNIALMMDEKLEKMAHDIKNNISQSLREVTERVGEAEQRIHLKAHFAWGLLS